MKRQETHDEAVAKLRATVAKERRKVVDEFEELRKQYNWTAQEEADWRRAFGLSK